MNWLNVNLYVLFLGLYLSSWMSLHWAMMHSINLNLNQCRSQCQHWWAKTITKVLVKMRVPSQQQRKMRIRRTRSRHQVKEEEDSELLRVVANSQIKIRIQEFLLLLCMLYLRFVAFHSLFPVFFYFYLMWRSMIEGAIQFLSLQIFQHIVLLQYLRTYGQES